MKIPFTHFQIFLIFLLFNSTISFSKTDSLKDQSSLEKKASHYTLKDIRAGERLFHGMTVSNQKILNCASCHNVQQIDTFNWNPSLMDLAKKFSGASTDSFKKSLLHPSGQLMTAIHDSLGLSDAQINELKAYLNYVAIHSDEPLRPLKTNRIIFILLVLLFVLAFIDLAFTHKIKQRYIHLLVLGSTSILLTIYIVKEAIGVGRSPGYQPDQPIKFSHAVHAGQNKINCLYCHFNAERSKFAGVPPVNVCMNCHIIVREGSRSGKFEIAKIYQAMDSVKPVVWVKVHNLPDHVYFNHSQHVVAGKIDCAKCHGDVTQFNEMKQVSDLSMGWCVNCHRQTGIQFDNKFYEKYKQVHQDLKEGKFKVVTAEKVGATDCMRCHY